MFLDKKEKIKVLRTDCLSICPSISIFYLRINSTDFHRI